MSHEDKREEPSLNNNHSFIDAFFFNDNTKEDPSRQLLDMVRDIRRGVVLILIVLLLVALW